MTVEPGSEPTLFEAVGGQPFFDRLAGEFYRRLVAVPTLAALYPDNADALAAAEHWLALFLGQYWGGPATYNEQRGHPRLRMRHAPFLIGPRERDAWLATMTASVETLTGDEVIRASLLEYFEMAANHLVNSPT